MRNWKNRTLWTGNYLDHRQFFVVSLMALTPVVVAEEKVSVNPFDEVPLESVEVWRCFDFFDEDEDAALFKLTRYTEGLGLVQVAGTINHATFSIQGLDRRWDWDWSEDYSTFRYSIVVRPNGSANYYNFDFADEEGRAESRQIYKCEIY